MGHSEAEKARSKRIHAWIMFACGGWMLLSGGAAAYLAYSRSGAFFLLTGSAGRFHRPVFLKYHLPSVALGRRSGEPGMAWHPWNQKSLDEAKALDRLILLHVTASWSHPCRLMEELTYSDPAVAAWAGNNVLAVRVDSDERPDIAARYAVNGLPTTALILPTGEVLSEGTFMGPARFLPWARQVAGAYANNPAAVWAQREAAVRRAELLRSRKASGPQAPWTPGQARSVLETRMRDLIQAYDRAHGGFGRGIKRLEPEVLRFLLEYHRAIGNAAALDMLRGSLAGLLKLEDPVWGGFYRDSLSPDWSLPEFEKLLSIQAQAIQVLAEAYSETKEESYRKAAESAIAFVRRFLKSGDGYYSAMEADVRRPDGGWVEGEAYFRGSEADRKMIGLPAVDKTYYSGPNAELAWAYLSASRVLKRPDLAREGLRMLDWIWARGVGQGGAVRHVIGGSGAPGLEGYLPDELALARAELAAYSRADHANAKHLDRCRKLLAFVSGRLGDPSSDPNSAAAAALLYRDAGIAPGAEAESKRLSGGAVARADETLPALLAELALGEESR